MKAPLVGVPREVVDAMKQLRIARDRWLAAKRETIARRDRGLDWMREEPFTRTMADAGAYVGLASAIDDQKLAKRALLEAVDALLHHGFDLRGES